ncbi:3-dehydroquinate synthase [Haploplasma axanthum]|nr:3-dehydroquinate synthase [Haploplasma axanthum]
MIIETSNYNIFLTSDEISSFNEKIKEVYQGRKIFVITDQIVYDLYFETLKNSLKDFELFFVISKGKNFDSYQEVVNKLFQNKIQKNNLIIALGGGVVGDLGGFVASTIFRGIKYVQIPTTLLSQIDSSIGGKTAIDTEYGKNLLGSFYNPILVLIDTKFLDTLNSREYNNGMAEAIKMALLSNKELYEIIKYKEKLDILEIKKTIEYKKLIVEIDPYDLKERRVLNFGHTFGHAIEKTANYSVYKHGEAISYGMLVALKIGEKHNITNRFIYDDLLNVLKTRKLIETEILEYDIYKKDVFYDKKNESDGIDFIFLEEIGKPKIVRMKSEDL